MIMAESRRQAREKIVARKRAKGKLRKSHRFGEKYPMSSEQFRDKFMTGGES
jgi:hypothetical protein